MNPDHSDAPASSRARLAPPIERRPMRPTPWFGLMRGLLVALLPGLRYTWGGSNPTPWNLAARQRRRALFAVVIASGVMAALLLQASAPESPLPPWWLHAAFAVLLLAWLGAGLATALMGAWVLWRGDRHGLQLDDAHAPISAAARTAVVMPICNEDIATVFAGLRATAESLRPIEGTMVLLEDLAAAGIHLYLLSNMPESTFNLLIERHGFFSHFKYLVISGKILLLKPEPAIYQHLVDVTGIVPAESVFIDDLDRNVVAAREFGLEAIRFTSPEACRAELRGYLPHASL